jgi:hypothetical protein
VHRYTGIGCSCTVASTSVIQPSVIRPGNHVAVSPKKTECSPLPRAYPSVVPAFRADHFAFAFELKTGEEGRVSECQQSSECHSTKYSDRQRSILPMHPAISCVTDGHPRRRALNFANWFEVSSSTLMCNSWSGTLHTAINKCHT